MKIANLNQLNEFLKSQNYNTFDKKINIGFALRKNAQRIEEYLNFFKLSEQGKADIIVFLAENKENFFEIRIVAPDSRFNDKQINEFAHELKTIMSGADNLNLISSDRQDLNTLLRYILVYNIIHK